MPLFPFRKRKLAGTLLVALQFCALVGLIMLASPLALRGAVPLLALLLAGASIALAAWTLVHNKPGNFNIRPTPKAWGTLITTGPYRLIRHPMYTSVLLGGAALALIASSALSWAAWSALALVLVLKSKLEERWMREQHLDYVAYARESKRFIPWVL